MKIIKDIKDISIIEPNTLILADCMNVMKLIPDNSIDMILCDLPYGTTNCKWDTIIPIEPLWKEYNRVVKDNGAILLFGTEPFSSLLRVANIKYYRYDLIWEKSRFTNFLFIKKQFGKIHENISVFYKNQPVYNPQMSEGKPFIRKGTNKPKTKELMSKAPLDNNVQNNLGTRYPTSILKFPFHNVNNDHPTQKPLDLCKYLIKTFSNENETILDNTMGSGTTGKAAIELNRKFIGIENNEDYFEIATNKIII